MTEADAWREVAQCIDDDTLPRQAIRAVAGWDKLGDDMRATWLDYLADWSRSASLDDHLTPLSESLSALWFALEAEEEGR
jgi:gluconate kinase